VCDGGGGVAARVGGGVGVGECEACELEADAELEACAELEADAELDAELDACAEPDACAELDAEGEPEVEAPPRAVEVALADELLDDLETCPEGDGVRVAPPVDEECPLVGTVGVKMDGTEEPPPVQAETVTARRIATAAERPAIGHAPWAATGGIRRIFMNPPRMRIR
jgi:hypothetical protein